jgi:hypothetical protein
MIESWYILATLEDRLATKELSKDAPHTPHIDCGSLHITSEVFRVICQSTHVIGETQHDLWSTIPARCNILSHEALVASSLGISTTRTRGITTSETKIADLELAVGIDKKVAVVFNEGGEEN